MAQDSELAPSFVTVYDSVGWVRCVETDYHRLDAQLTAYIDSGKTRDSLLDLTALDGRAYRILASEVKSFLLSTPTTRRREVEIEADLKAEQKLFKQEAGIAWEDNEHNH